MVISSLQNVKVKQLKKLQTSKEFVFFDNPKLIEEAISAGHKVEYILKKEGCFEKTDYGGEEVVFSDNVFKTFSSTETSQGIIGVVKFITRKMQKPVTNFLVLDSLQDPGNVGTLIRSALGANFLDIYLVNSVKPSNDKVIRSSMGAIFKTRIYSCTKQEFMIEYKKWKLPLISCNLQGANLFTSNISGQVGVLVGNEGNGVSKELQELSTSTINIPMQNNLESLNAGVSGSIVMYYIANKINN